MDRSQIIYALVVNIIKVAVLVFVFYIAKNQYELNTGKKLTWDMILGKESMFDTKGDGCAGSIEDGAMVVKRNQRFHDQNHGNGLLCFTNEGILKKSQTGEVIHTTTKDEFTVEEYDKLMLEDKGF
ncbi:hypothetical protein EXVG_00062 [Emiliania huxleyi virus 202]|nr:hypothetical protein EXVG_00062 [Emiliania huxleyi virus 202]AHA54487.1 putative membrane protein [Emiliania huxleyi virus 18]AHA55529.1 putative membrane protein [Emiliania huxleyi virus 156]